MKFFLVTVKGSGIRLAIAGVEAVGFLRLVRVAAKEQLAAGTLAIAKILADWRNGLHAKHDKGGNLRLTIDRTVELPWWRRFISWRSGYMFFAIDDNPPAVPQ